MKILVQLFSLLFLVGCATKWVYNHNADEKFPPKGENCAFKIVNTLPKQGYSEIGTLNAELKDGKQTNVEEFREAIQQKVCAVGGDLVVGEVNGYGWYIKGIVFRKSK